MPVIIDGTNGITQAGEFNSDSSFGFKNRIINGAMVIDQRNAGASVTQGTSFSYPVDRFGIVGSVTSKFTAQQNAGSVTPPAGFINYLGCTSSSAYSVPSGELYIIRQGIEGFNIADLAWGTANAKTVTLSFWVYSSLTGTFGGSLRNNAADRSYPYSYTISSANTWEYKTVTIAGDTTGTWLTNNSAGIILFFSLGTGSTFSNTAGAWAAGDFRSATGATSVVGTSGATFYITGVQLEVGSTATSFDYRPYGTELQLCQRYYQTFGDGGQNNQNFTMFQAYSTTAVSGGVIPFFAKMRTVPTFTYSALGDFAIQNSSGSGITPTVIQIGGSENSTTVGSIRGTVASGLVAGNAAIFFAINTNARLNFSAEL
jgi:hypothetical protein